MSFIQTVRASIVKQIISKILVSALLMFGASVAAAAGDPIYTGTFSNKAVGGYDTVAYFTEGKPVKGEKKFRTEYKGAEWRFASQENLDTFLADPEKYAPQYGGYCAWAMAGAENGTRPFGAKGSPKHWEIVDGKLYLNYDANIKDKWVKDIPGFIGKADTFYPQFLED